VHYSACWGHATGGGILQREDGKVALYDGQPRERRSSTRLGDCAPRLLLNRSPSSLRRKLDLPDTEDDNRGVLAVLALLGQ